MGQERLCGSALLSIENERAREIERYNLFKIKNVLINWNFIEINSINSIKNVCEVCDMGFHQFKFD